MEILDQEEGNPMGVVHRMAYPESQDSGDTRTDQSADLVEDHTDSHTVVDAGNSEAVAAFVDVDLVLGAVLAGSE